MVKSILNLSVSTKFSEAMHKLKTTKPDFQISGFIEEIVTKTLKENKEYEKYYEIIKEELE